MKKTITFVENKTAKHLYPNYDTFDNLDINVKNDAISQGMAVAFESRAFRKALNKVRKERAGKAKEANNAN